MEKYVRVIDRRNEAAFELPRIAYMLKALVKGIIADDELSRRWFHVNYYAGECVAMGGYSIRHADPEVQDEHHVVESLVKDVRTIGLVVEAYDEEGGAQVVATFDRPEDAVEHVMMLSIEQFIIRQGIDRAAQEAADVWEACEDSTTGTEWSRKEARRCMEDKFHDR